MQTVIHFRHEEDNALTDVTSVVLRDPTGAYGVRRRDTGAVVVAAGTALTRVSTGVYQYAFDDPAAGLEYEYYLRWVYGGETTEAPFTIQGATVAVTGRYHAYADLIALAGTENVRIASQLDNDTAAVDQTRVAAAIAWSEALVESRLAQRFAIPLAPTQAFDVIMLKDTCARLSIWWLNQNRGVSDENGDLSGKISKMKTTAINQLGAWASCVNAIFSSARAHPLSPSAPIGVDLSDINPAGDL